MKRRAYHSHTRRGDEEVDAWQQAGPAGGFGAPALNSTKRTGATTPATGAPNPTPGCRRAQARYSSITTFRFPNNNFTAGNPGGKDGAPMSKFEYLMSLKAELKELRSRLETLKNSAPTKENLELVEAITARAKDLKVYIHHYATKYGMAA